MFFILGGGQNPLVPALDAGTQKSKPYQSDVYMTGFNAIPRQAREQDSFDTPPICHADKSLLCPKTILYSSRELESIT